MGFGDDGAAISTQNFSIDAELPSLYGGVGLNIVKDNIAQFSNLGVQASYAYRTELVGQIGMGMSVEFSKVDLMVPLRPLQLEIRLFLM